MLVFSSCFNTVIVQTLCDIAIITSIRALVQVGSESFQTRFGCLFDVFFGPVEGSDFEGLAERCVREPER